MGNDTRSRGASPYARLIDATHATLAQRAKLYRRLVIGIAASALVIAASALALRSWLPLFALAIWLPMTWAFVHADRRSVGHWQRLVREADAAGELRIGLLQQTLRQVPGLPPQTLEGLLQSLDDESVRPSAPPR